MWVSHDGHTHFERQENGQDFANGMSKNLFVFISGGGYIVDFEVFAEPYYYLRDTLIVGREGDSCVYCQLKMFFVSHDDRFCFTII